MTSIRLCMSSPRYKWIKQHRQSPLHFPFDAIVSRSGVLHSPHPSQTLQNFFQFPILAKCATAPWYTCVGTSEATTMLPAYVSRAHKLCTPATFRTSILYFLGIKKALPRHLTHPYLSLPCSHCRSSRIWIDNKRLIFQPPPPTTRVTSSVIVKQIASLIMLQSLLHTHKGCDILSATRRDTCHEAKRMVVSYTFVTAACVAYCASSY